MRRQTIIALGIALVLGILAVYLANVYLTRSDERADAVQAGMTKVAVAAIPLEYGTQLTPDKVKFVDEPIAYTGASSAPATGGARPSSTTTTGAANPVVRVGVADAAAARLTAWRASDSHAFSTRARSEPAGHSADALACPADTRGVPGARERARIRQARPRALSNR